MTFDDKNILSSKLKIAENEALLDFYRFKEIARYYNQRARVERDRASLIGAADYELWCDTPTLKEN